MSINIADADIIRSLEWFRARAREMIFLSVIVHLLIVIGGIFAVIRYFRERRRK